MVIFTAASDNVTIDNVKTSKMVPSGNGKVSATCPACSPFAAGGGIAGTIETSSYTFGRAPRLNIYNTSNLVDLSADTPDNLTRDSYLGGTIGSGSSGYYTLNITSALNRGYINAESISGRILYAGGLIGSISAPVNIDKSCNYANILGNVNLNFSDNGSQKKEVWASGLAGYVVGHSEGTSVSQSCNTGDVTAVIAGSGSVLDLRESYSGGLFGIVYYEDSGVAYFSDNYNTGDVYSETNHINGDSYAGGIVSYTQGISDNTSAMTIKNNFNLGK
ncbi:MAG: hypothetical protein LBD73_08570 [Deferribacteraceae bacterium]|jgi:hypothetical protein|nr:hypothetical protein [Deferribacteraceae bacterium]